LLSYNGGNEAGGAGNNNMVGRVQHIT
jgi:hypothetical protein